MNENNQIKNRLPHKNYFELCAACGICNDACTVNTPLGEDRASRTTPQNIAQHLLRIDKALDGIEGEKTANETEISPPETYICTGCGLCSHVCPYFVPFLDNLLEARQWARSMGIESPPDVIVTMDNHIFTEGNPFGNPKYKRDEWVRDDFPEKDKADVVYYPGCSTAYQLFGLEKAIFKVLEASGVSVTYLGKADGCCGRPQYFSGRGEEMEKTAISNVESIRQKSAKVLLVNCPSCFLAFKKHYPPYVGRLPFSVYHTTEYFNFLVREKRISFSKSMNKSVIYHDPCELGRIGGVFEEPRELLRALPGVKLLEFDKNRSDGMCCGGGGLFEAVDEKQSFSIGEKVILEALEKKADILATACPTCNAVFNMAKDNLSRKSGSKIKLKIRDVSEIVLKCI